MAVQSIEEEARAYVKQYWTLGSTCDFGNYRCDLIAGLLDLAEDRDRQLNEARAKISELAIKLSEERARAASARIAR